MSRFSRVVAKAYFLSNAAIFLTSNTIDISCLVYLNLNFCMKKDQETYIIYMKW